VHQFVLVQGRVHPYMVGLAHAHAYPVVVVADYLRVDVVHKRRLPPRLGLLPVSLPQRQFFLESLG